MAITIPYAIYIYIFPLLFPVFGCPLASRRFRRSSDCATARRPMSLSTDRFSTERSRGEHRTWTNHSPPLRDPRAIYLFVYLLIFLFIHLLNVFVCVETSVDCPRGVFYPPRFRPSFLWFFFFFFLLYFFNFFPFFRPPSFRFVLLAFFFPSFFRPRRYAGSFTHGYNGRFTVIYVEATVILREEGLHTRHTHTHTHVCALINSTRLSTRIVWPL